MGTISFSASFLLSAFLLHLCLYSEVAARYPVTGSDREALEIIIGGGGGGYPAPPSPPEPLCPPPPPPPPPLSRRILMVYPVIQKFKRQICHDPLNITSTWDDKVKDVCKYKGFNCATVPDLKQRALAGVDFNGYGFAGGNGNGLSLCGFIDMLPDIVTFHANSNNFTGGVPTNISTLRYFYELDLSNNKLNGKFPMEVLRATNLTFLDLRFNHLEGTVPPGVFKLDVDVIFINNNKFEQNLPANLGSTPALYLTFANNMFTGPIPPTIGTGNTSKNLLEVLFLNNQLTGCLPYEIGLLKSATLFDVSINKLTGPIPHSFQCLKKIQILNLSQNQFYGAVPEAICKLPNLNKLTLSVNYFTQIGPECWKLIKKKVLDVKMNCIIDLPGQRSKAECDAFYSKARYHTCPNEKSLTIIPCKNTYYSDPLGASADQPTVAAPPPLSYNALIPHK